MTRPSVRFVGGRGQWGSSDHGLRCTGRPGAGCEPVANGRRRGTVLQKRRTRTLRRHSYVASLGRLVPRLRGQEFTEDERETVRRGIARVRAAADWLEAAIDNGEFTLDEQLAQLLKGE
ncbi:DUF6192 family protein [Streptomyces sp. NPDC046727]|uniref:DUF6192 family protein n=1 Tax=Streptomyces sp. NPDC046727 TaxID=3155373 RepID=UPI0033F8BA2D